MKPSRVPKRVKRRNLQAKETRIYRHNKGQLMASDFDLKPVHQPKERVRLDPKEFFEEPIRVETVEEVVVAPTFDSKSFVANIFKLFA